MKRFNPFSPVDGKYGSPMGRAESTVDLLRFGRRHIAAQHQGGGEGYDRGGAYWGLPSDVWAVWVTGDGPSTVKYVRAKSREEALRLLLS